MDIIDVMLAKALTPQGQIESYARQSQEAVKSANEAVAAIDSISEQMEANSAKAEETLTTAEQAAASAAAAEERVNSALEHLEASSSEQVQNEIDKLALEISGINGSTTYTKELNVLYPSGKSDKISGLEKLYKSTGSNEDGSMTQRAITNALSALGTRIDNIQITGGGNASGISNLGVDAAGHIVVIGADGNIKAGDVSEESIISALIKAGTYTTDGTLGVTVDYENKSSERTQDAATGKNFDTYAMYGGRMRCNVADDGTILAFYGDANYKDDGSNGQVMLYQPKFYYQRTFIKETSGSRGIVVQKESLILSPTARAGFRVHPLFYHNGEELDYVLTPVYEGSVYDTSESKYLLADDDVVNFSEDKLCSIAGVKPLTGINNDLTVEKLNALAANRGKGWQLTNAEFESALQMLEMVEFGSMNGQLSLEAGPTSLPKDTFTITGSTASLGNKTGAAESSIADNNGTRSTRTIAGQRAISYRGMENPWGNLWRLISNLTVRGGGNSLGGTPYYDATIPLNFNLPESTGKWISAMGYRNQDFLWLYMPIECANSANSAVPIGDALWTNAALNGENLVGIGGQSTSAESAGPFYYSCDAARDKAVRTFNGRIMFIPEKNSTYESNITKWRQHYGG